ncbi:hypothetical protein PtA15_3A707 [Puccinia triticina]|uniref:Uncharacterized protein n=1 Tax=Puccinia triticina TaxID=208348 RepID=A0ABY7CKJ7_9BASI|nr:uncharacterized protein PtA15_3A707 [Puccinia triticina]WAQ83337.1 hypothetical protein PtA15_3A707 [Puccinia triticina]
MRAGAAEIRAANQCNSANSGYVVSAAPVPPMASAPPMGNPEYETNSVPEPLAWVPYAGITNVLDEIPPGENHMNEAGSQFSEEISDVDYSSLEHEARSVLLSDLDSNGEADGEEWEMDPGDLQAIIGVVLPSVQETPNHDLPEVPRSRKHRQSHQVNVPTISGQATSLDHNSSIKGRYKGITWIGYARGKDVYKLSQSWKWLEGLEQSARAPMVRAESGDFYLYEPLQLSNDDIVVPLYFYTAGGELWSKCVSPDFNPEINGSGLRLTIPGDTSFTSVQLLTIPLGVKDTLNKAIIDRKYGIIAKKEDATLEELKFLEDHKSLDAERQKAIFNAFFEIDGEWATILSAPENGCAADPWYGP